MKTKVIYMLATIFVLLLTNNCKTTKNTPTTRAFHNLTAKYNVYFNCNEAFKSGKLKLDNTFKDNYSEILPIFKYSDDQAVTITQGEMDRAIQKSAKTITNHSITARPKRKDRSKGMSDAEKDFYAKPDYCNWIDDSYLIMGKAHFYKHEFDIGINSFRLLITRFKLEQTRFEATLWLVKTYIEQKKWKDAEDYLSALESDKRHPINLDQEINLTFADLYVRQQKYKQAIERLEKGIELTKKKKHKARYIFILAQLNQKIGNNEKATELYGAVIKMNPPYEMAFNAKINRATIFQGAAANANELKKQLRKMLKDDKNIEFRDQIYFALANLEIKDNNEKEAIKYFELSAKWSKSNPTQKALSYLALADIYFDRPDYLIAGAYYDSTMKDLSPKYSGYEQISKKAKNLSNLIINLKEIAHQDSLQRIANMSESDRLAFIDRIIAKVREDEIKKQKMQQQNQSVYYQDPEDQRYQENQTTKGKWYFYNAQLITLGKIEFEKKWGERKLEDNWRRRNKAISIEFTDNHNDQTNKTDSSKVVDNKSREYYLQELPLGDSAMAVSNKKIVNAMYNAGEIYYIKMKDFDEAEKILEKLNQRIPKHYLLLDTYYMLYQLCLEAGKNDRAEYYKSVIIRDFPESKFAKMLSDPNYIQQLLSKQQQAFDFFDNTFIAYNNADYNTVINNSEKARQDFENSPTLPKFAIIEALSYGNIGNTEKMQELLEAFIKKYPRDEAVTLAQNIIELNKSGKYKRDIYKNHPNDDHFYVLVIKDKRADINQIKFTLTSFYAENPNLILNITEESIEDSGKMLITRKFKSAAEAKTFLNNLISNNILKDVKPELYTHFIIASKNYEIFLKDKIIDKYLDFFNKSY